MQIEKKAKYTLINSNEISFKDFINSLKKELEKLKKEHLIIQFSDDINISDKDFLLFLDIAEKKKENGTSFVIIFSEIDIDGFPENLNIVPTLIEAEDIIEMEAIERELGF